MAREGKWVRIDPASMGEAQKRVRDSHDMGRQVLNWRCCKHCGILGLKNEATRKALRGKCVSVE